MRNNYKKIYLVPFLLLSIYSFGTSVNQCDTLGNNEENFIQEGTFSNVLYDAKGNRTDISFLELLGHYFSDSDSIHISVHKYKTLIITFTDNSGPRTISYQGKQKRKYFEYYRVKKRFYIPLFYSRTNIVRYRIKSLYTGDLVIKLYTNTSANWFFFAAGGSSKKTYLLKK